MKKSLITSGPALCMGAAKALVKLRMYWLLLLSYAMSKISFVAEGETLDDWITVKPVLSGHSKKKTKEMS